MASTSSPFSAIWTAEAGTTRVSGAAVPHPHTALKSQLRSNHSQRGNALGSFLVSASRNWSRRRTISRSIDRRSRNRTSNARRAPGRPYNARL